MDTELIDRRINRIDVILESCQSPELREQFMEERIDLGEQKIQKCDDLMTKVMNQEANGLITEEAAEEMYREIENAKTNLMFETYPWYEDAANAEGLALALNETSALAANAFVSLIPANAIGKVITLPLRKFILSRLSKYNILYQDAINFKELKHEKYDLEEAEKRGFKFKHASSWLDKGISRVHVIIYSYKNKDVMGCAYTKDIHVGVGMQGLVEPIIKDGSFNKHTDYYVACMCTDLQMTHPAVKRVLKKLKKGWSDKVNSLKSDIQESVEESIADGTYQDRMNLILECAKDGRVTPHSALNYVREMKCAEMHLD